MISHTVTGYTGNGTLRLSLIATRDDAIEAAESLWAAGDVLAAEVHDGRGRLVAIVCQKGCVHDASSAGA